MQVIIDRPFSLHSKKDEHQYKIEGNNMKWGFKVG